MKALEIIEALQVLASEDKAKHLNRFFKTGKGQYGEGDKMMGIVVPETRKVAKEYKSLPLSELQTLLDNEWHEVRLCGLLILIFQYKDRKATTEMRQCIFDLYLRNMRRCNNWDLVDLSCRDIVGMHLLDKDRGLLDKLSESDNLWEQRIAIVSTWAFIKHGEFENTFRLAIKYISHDHDLIHKATGWMLREVGKKDREALTAFLEEYAPTLPRTALRYAIEHYPEDERQYFLKRKNKQ